MNSSPNELARFGEKLRKIRTYNKMTLNDVATHLGYTTHSYLSEIESGNKIPTVSFVIKVSRLFNVSIDELLKDELEMSLPINEKD